MSGMAEEMTCVLCGRRIFTDRCGHCRAKLNRAKRTVAGRELAQLVKGRPYSEGTDAAVPGSDVYGSYWWPMVRDAVLERDAGACQMCGGSEDAEVHHIMYRCDGGSDHPYNLITLCRPCHDRVHGRFKVHIGRDQRKLDSFAGEEGPEGVSIR